MRIIDILHSPWAIKPERLVEISEIYSRHLRGEKISRETLHLIEAQIGKPLQNKPHGFDVVQGIAVLPVEGVLSKRMNLFTQISGGTSTELLARDLRAALDDPGVTGIILSVDSPGGTVDGTQELADMIHAARGVKPIVTHSGGMMASAAYWVGSAADSVWISGDTVDVGSIGVVTSHTDYSKREEMLGIKVTEITAGQYKRIASEHAPLTESGRAYIQEQLDHIYEVFLTDVGRNRGGLSAKQVHDQMADGRIFIGKKAVSAGLADGVSGLSGLIEQMAAGALPRAAQSSTVSFAAAAQTAAGVAAAETPQREEEIMNLTELKEKHPALYKEAFDAGRMKAAEDMECPEECKEEAKEQGVTEGKALGAKAELERIKAVKAVARNSADMEALEPMMFDGKTTGEQAAVRLIEQDKAKLSAKAEAIKADGEELKVAASTGADDGAAKSMKRAEFNKLAPAAQAAHIKSGGTVAD